MKSIAWLLQDVGTNQMLFDNFNTVKNINSHYITFSLLNEHEALYLNEIPSTDLILRGGIKALKLINKSKSLFELLGDVEFEIKNEDLILKYIKNSIFYNDNFDQLNYSKLDLPLLNKDAFYIKIKDNLNITFDKEYFIKPSKDLKSFLPGIINKNQTIKDFIINSAYRKEYIEEDLLVASIKKINAEYRFFIINKKVITYSQYIKNNRVEHHPFVPNNIIEVAKEYALLYQPHDIFTMDLADTNEGIKIVEYNCWNASGLYKSEKEKLFNEIQNYKREQ